MKKLKDNSVVLDTIALTEQEVQFFQLMANDETIENAAEILMISKRTCEDRMYRLQNHYGLRTRHGLIAHLIRKKVIK